MPQSGQMGNKCVPGGFCRSEQQPQGLILFWDRSKSSEDSKQKQILTSSGFIIKKSIHAPTLAFVTKICCKELRLSGVFIEHE